jgi:hypothetical protein
VNTVSAWSAVVAAVVSPPAWGDDAVARPSHSSVGLSAGLNWTTSKRTFATTGSYVGLTYANYLVPTVAVGGEVLLFQYSAYEDGESVVSADEVRAHLLIRWVPFCEEVSTAPYFLPWPYVDYQSIYLQLGVGISSIGETRYDGTDQNSESPGVAAAALVGFTPFRGRHGSLGIESFVAAVYNNGLTLTLGVGLVFAVGR